MPYRNSILTFFFFFSYLLLSEKLISLFQNLLLFHLSIWDFRLLNYDGIFLFSSLNPSLNPVNSACKYIHILWHPHFTKSEMCCCRHLILPGGVNGMFSPHNNLTIVSWLIAIERCYWLKSTSQFQRSINVKKMWILESVKYRILNLSLSALF